jgi:3-dehydroquinate synthase
MAEPRVFTVRAEAGDYEVVVGDGVRTQLRAFAQGKPRVALVTDENVARHWGEELRALLDEPPTLTLPPGEGTKTLRGAEAIFAFLVREGFTRSDVLIAAGGGVVGDLAGFAAATFHRGMALVHVPTTLLAQVDSSIGGKVAVDLPEGKNLVGAFHAPRRVLADTGLLATLPQRERWNGLAEVTKAAAIADAPLLAQLDLALEDLASGKATSLPEVIAAAIAVKVEVVSRDERERGPRLTLNFGHTFGHALEAATGFGALLHGEAIVVGMRVATALSARRGLSGAEAVRLDAVLARFPLPRGIACERNDLRARLQRDKKGARFILLEALGRAVVVEDVDREAVLDLAQPFLEALL